MRQKEKEESLEEISRAKSEYEDPNLDHDENRKKFYQSKSKHTPEYR